MILSLGNMIMNTTELSLIETVTELQKFLHCDNLLNEGLANINEYMSKITLLKQSGIDLSNIKERTNDNRVYIYIDRKQYIASTRKELIDKLFIKFCNEAVMTLEDLFPLWMLYRRDELHTNDKTLKENHQMWKSMYADKPIVKIPLSKLTVKDWVKFFRSITLDGVMTRKKFNDGKSVLNGIYYYCINERDFIEKDIIKCNPLREINYKSFKYKPENTSIDIYSLEERERLIEYLIELGDTYSLAIAFDFCIIARISELKSLKWTDISNDGNFIRIQSQILSYQTMNDDLTFNLTEKEDVGHVKGNTKQGFRNLPLIPTAKRILNIIKSNNPDETYIFLPDGKFMETCTFNRHLKKACKQLDIPYRSSHKIRFSVSSHLYHNNIIDISTLQNMLGHTTLNMTMHYIRANEDNENTLLQVSNFLK